MKTIVTLTVGLSLVLVLTLMVFRLPVGPSLQLIWEGGLGNAAGLSRTAVKATPLLLAALGMVVAWRAGMYNIGGEGQFVVGGLFGGIVAHLFMGSTLPGPVIMLAILIACVAGGVTWAMVAAWLSIRRGVEVVISTILLNFVAIQLLAWAVSGPLQEAKHQVPMSDALPESWLLPKFTRQLDINAGSVLAILAAVAIFVFLFRTVAGYRLRLVGENPRAARSYLVPPAKAQYMAMAISGGLCGLAGGVDYLGVAGQLSTSFSQQWGFLAIPVALLGGLHPLGVIPSSIYFGVLFAGSENLSRFTPAGTTIIYVIQSSAVLAFVGLRSEGFRRWVERRRKPSSS